MTIVSLMIFYTSQLGPNIEVEVPTGVGPNDTILAATSAIALEKFRVYQVRKRCINRAENVSTFFFLT